MIRAMKVCGNNKYHLLASTAYQESIHVFLFSAHNNSTRWHLRLREITPLAPNHTAREPQRSLCTQGWLTASRRCCLTFLARRHLIPPAQRMRRARRAPGERRSSFVCSDWSESPGLKQPGLVFCFCFFPLLYCLRALYSLNGFFSVQLRENFMLPKCRCTILWHLKLLLTFSQKSCC